MERSPFHDVSVPLQSARPYRTMPPGCIREAIDHDDYQRMYTQWTVGTVTATVIGAMHLLRWMTTPPGPAAVRETAVFVCATAALLCFVNDLQRCRNTEGVIKLTALLFVAHVVVPFLWPASVVNTGTDYDDDDHDEEEEEILLTA